MSDELGIEQCGCGIWSRGLVDGKCADCRDRMTVDRIDPVLVEKASGRANQNQAIDEKLQFHREIDTNLEREMLVMKLDTKFFFVYFLLCCSVGGATGALLTLAIQGRL